MRSLSWMVLVTVACSGGDTADTDPGFPEGCIFATSADRFTFSPTAVGSDAVGIVQLEARCPDSLGLTFVWEEPTSGDFTYEGGDSRTLEPYTPDELRITFAPSRTGAIEDRLIIRTDNPSAGGVILRLEGEGQ